MIKTVLAKTYIQMTFTHKDTLKIYHNLHNFTLFSPDHSLCVFLLIGVYFRWLQRIGEETTKSERLRESHKMQQGTYASRGKMETGRVLLSTGKKLMDLWNWTFCPAWTFPEDQS